jgi:hypothetical protein
MNDAELDKKIEFCGIIKKFRTKITKSRNCKKGPGTALQAQLLSSQFLFFLLAKKNVDWFIFETGLLLRFSTGCAHALPKPKSRFSSLALIEVLHALMASTAL